LVGDFWLLAFGFRHLTIGYQLTVNGYRLSVIGYRFLKKETIAHQTDEQSFRFNLLGCLERLAF